MIKKFSLIKKFSFLKKIPLKKFSSNEEEMNYNVCIVGGGIAGLSTAIKLKQLQKDISVCVLEKGAEIGSHILSGNCFESSSLNLLFPDYQKQEKPPLHQKVTKEIFEINLSQNFSLNIPHFLFPKKLHNFENHIISLGELCLWLSKKAEELGVDIITGFACDKFQFNDKKEVIGILTKEFGIDKLNKKTEKFSPAVKINANLTVLAEGARGSLSEQAIQIYNLRENCDPQSYGIGIKEIWEVPQGVVQPGLVKHSVGWPVPSDTYSGGFFYAKSDTQIHIGFIVGLDYKNPYLNPYEEFQKWKTQKNNRKILEKGKCVKYGARVINEGGFYSIPKVFFPGGILVGCSAGFLNVIKIKGAHNALKSGVLAAQEISQVFVNKQLKEGIKLEEYEKKLKTSEIMKELEESRNFKGTFKKGLFRGLLYGFLNSWFGYQKENRVKIKDSEKIEEAKLHKKIDYPKHDGKITFDILESVSRSDTFHDHNQMSHLQVKNAKSWQKSLEKYAGFEQRYCPAKVYEFIENEKGEKTLQINAQNCVHCKTCSIKSLEEYIDWKVPQGREGPQYQINLQEENESVLKSSSQNWKIQKELLEKLTREIQEENEESFTFVQKNAILVGNLIYNLRSAFVAVVCELIEETLQQGAKKQKVMEEFCRAILLNDNFIQCLNSGNKVIFVHSQKCFQKMVLNQSFSVELLKEFFEKNFLSKNQQLRKELAWGIRTFFEQKLKQKEKEKIEIEFKFFENSKKGFETDKTESVRKEGKKIGELIDSYLNMKIQELDKDKNELEDEKKTNPSENQEEELELQIQQKKKSVFDVLEDSVLSIADKKKIIDKFDFEEFFEKAKFEDLKRTLEINEQNKNHKIAAFCGSLLQKFPLKNFVSELLDFLIQKQFSKNSQFSLFMNRVLKLSTSNFVEKFLQQNSFKALSLLQKRFNPSTFNKYVPKNITQFEILIQILLKNLNANSSQEFCQNNAEFLQQIWKQQNLQKIIYEVSQKLDNIDFFKQNFPDLYQKIFVFKEINLNQTVSQKTVETSLSEKELIINKIHSEKKISNNFEIIIKSKENNDFEEPFENKFQEFEQIIKNQNDQSFTYSEENQELFEEVKNKIISKPEIFMNMKDTRLIQILQFLTLNEKDEKIKEKFGESFLIKVNSEKQNLNKEEFLALVWFFDHLSNENFLRSLFKYSNLPIKIQENFSECFSYNNNQKHFEFLKVFLDTLKNTEKTQILSKSFKELQQKLQECLNHPDLTVRKNTVMLISSLRSFTDENEFDQILQTFQPEHQQIINLYILKRK